MARARTGGVVRRPNGKYSAKFRTTVDGKSVRKTYELDTTDRDTAIALMKQLIKKAESGKDLKAGESVAEYVARWVVRRDRRKQGTTEAPKEEEGIFRRQIFKVIDPELPIRILGRREAMSLLTYLDDKLASKAISLSVARKAWFLFGRLCADACGSPVPGLRVKDENPVSGMIGPAGIRTKSNGPEVHGGDVRLARFLGSIENTESLSDLAIDPRNFAVVNGVLLTACEFELLVKGIRG